MLHSIGVALKAFFSMITTFCHAGEKVAMTADELAGWGHESAAAFHDEAKHNRALSLEEAAFNRKKKARELAALQAADEATPAAIAGAKGNKQIAATAATA